MEELAQAAPPYAAFLTVPGKVNQECATPNLIAVEETPDPAVPAVAPVVAQEEVMASGNNLRAPTLQR